MTAERDHRICRRLRAWSGPARACACWAQLTSPPALEVVGTDPVVNVFADYRTRITQLDPRWLGGEMWGYLEGDRLASMCHVGANIVPVQHPRRGLRGVRRPRAPRRRRAARRSSARSDAVWLLWAGLEEHWPRPREFRWDQPHLRDHGAVPTVAVRPDGAAYAPRTTRRALPGLRGDVHRGGRHLARRSTVAGPLPRAGEPAGRPGLVVLAHRGRAGAVQGRGGLCDAERLPDPGGVRRPRAPRPGAVARPAWRPWWSICLREIAPVVSLYVNGHNAPARAAYRKAGFEQTGDLHDDHVLTAAHDLDATLLR